MSEKRRKDGKVVGHSMLRRRRTWNTGTCRRESPSRASQSEASTSGNFSNQQGSSPCRRDSRKSTERFKAANIERSGRQLPHTPHNHRLELAINKFDLSLPFHLDMINSHRDNIIKLQRAGDPADLKVEVEKASRSVRQLGSLLFEMEVLKSYLETPQDLAYFDQRVEPSKEVSCKTIKRLHDVCPISNYSGLSSSGSKRSSSLTPCAKTPESELDTRYTRRYSDSDSQSISSLSYYVEGQSRESLLSNQDPNTVDPTGSSDAGRTMETLGRPGFSSASRNQVDNHQQHPLDILYEDPKEDATSILSEEEKKALNNDKIGSTDEMWALLEEEIRDINILMKQFSYLPGSEMKVVYENAKNRCSERKQGGYSFTTVYPMAGALLGTMLGGPVGFLAGIKIGGLAAIGGSFFGYSTGSLIKEHTERQEYISKFYSKHNDRLLIDKISVEKRAVSLPDILDDDNKICQAEFIPNHRLESTAKSTESLL